eukprot:403339681
MPKNNITGGNFSGNGPLGSGGNSLIKRRNFLQQDENSVSRFVQLFKKKMFTANHLMIQAFQMHPMFLFLILILEYLQTIYYALFNLEIHNNFSESYDYHRMLEGENFLQSNDSLSEMLLNYTVKTISSNQSGNNNNFENSQESILNWKGSYNLLRYLNYHLLIIEQKGKTAFRDFQIALYLHLSIFILLLMGLLWIGSRKVMRAEEFNQQDHATSGSKIISKFKSQMKAGQAGNENIQQNHRKTNQHKYSDHQNLILSIIVFVSLQLLVLPTFHLYSTIINCSKLEGMGTYKDEYGATVNEFTCLNRDHVILIAVSSIMVVVALFCIFLEAILFQDLNMKSKLPWRQIPSRIHQIKLFKKILIALFNFEILTDSPIALGIFTFYQFSLMFERYQYTRIYQNNFKYWTLFAEFSIFWLAFWNFLQKTAKFNINIYGFIFLILGGLFPYYFVMLQIYTKWKFARIFRPERQSFKEMGSDVVAESYFGYLLDLIQSSEKNEDDRIKLYGILRNHWYACKFRKSANEKCLCNTLIQRINQIERYIDYDFQSRNDQFDIIKIQKKIGSIEERIIKEEEEEKQNLVKQNIINKQSINIDNLLFEIRKSEKKVSTKSSFNLKPSSTTNRRQKDLDIIYEYQSSAFENGSSMNVQNVLHQMDQQKGNSEVTQQRTKNIQNSIEKMNEIEVVREHEELHSQLSKSELRKQIRNLFYRHVYNMIEEAGKTFPFSFRLKYLASYIQYYLLKNEIKGLFEILMIERKNKIPLEWQFFLYKVKIEIEDYMDKVHKQRSSTSGRIDVKKVYLFAKNLQKFENGIEQISDKCLEFWKELLKKSDFDANNLHKVGTEITLMNMQIYNLVLSMFNINPHHGYLLRIYAIFTQKVMNNDEESEKYFKKFLNAQKTFQSYEAATLFEELVKNFSSNVKYVVIVMRVSTHEIGIVEDVNHEIRDLLGYRRNEVIGKNMQMLMPKCVGNLHDQFLQNYLETAKPKVLNKQREVFGLKKNGFLVQVFIYVTSVPMIEKEGIKFVGFLKKVDEKKHTELLPPPIEYQFRKSIQIMAAPNGNIYGINEQAYKILGFPKYFTEESDDKYSDYNMSQIIIDYNKVIFECFKMAPVGRRAYLDTDNLKSFIVPDMHSKNDMKHIKNCFGCYEVYIQACPLDFGFKGGAYLPMIIIRIYVIDKVSRKTLERMKSPNRKMTTMKTNMSRKSSRFMKAQSLYLGRSAKSSEMNIKYQERSIALNDLQLAILEQDDEQSKDDDLTKMAKEMMRVDPRSREIQQFLESSQSSISQSNEGKSTDIARLREFRKMVNSRKEPQTVIFLRRFVVFVTAIILALVSLNTGLKINFYTGFESLTIASFLLQDITIHLYEIHSGFRSLINIQNGFQEDEIVGYVKKDELHTELIRDISDYLNEINDHKSRFIEFDKSILSEISHRLENIEIYEIDSDTSLSSQKINMNLALNRNVFLSLIQRCEGIQVDIENLKDTFINSNQISFVVVISSIMALSVVSIALIFYFVKQIHKTRIQSLSLYSELNIDDIGEVIADLAVFKKIIKDNSDDLNRKIYQRKDDSSEDDCEDQYFQDNYEDMEDQNELQSDENPSIPLRLMNEAMLRRKKLDALYSIPDQAVTYKKFRTSGGGQLPADKASELDSMHSSDFDDSFYSKIQNEQNNSSKIQSKENFVNIKPGIASEKIKLPSLNKSLSNSQEENAQSNNDTSREILNDPNMSQRDLKQSHSQISISQVHKDRQNKRQKNSIQAHNIQLNSGQEVPPQEDITKKVGNLEKFAMVKSNSSLRVISIVMALFSFVILHVIVNFSIYVPMFNELIISHDQEQIVLNQFKVYYRIYTQFQDDLSQGFAGMSQSDPTVTYYALFQQQKFDNQQKIQEIIQSHKKSQYVDKPINVVLQLNSKNYCQTLETYYSSTFNPLNITFCETVDNGVAGNQGFKIQIDRYMGELNKLRLIFEERNNNPNRLISLFNKDQVITKFQLLINRLFTPTFYALKNCIEENFQTFIKIYQNLDISILSVFIAAQMLILLVAWPRFLRKMNNQISKSRGILTLIPSRLIISNNNIKQIIEQNKLLTQ